MIAVSVAGAGAGYLIVDRTAHLFYAFLATYWFGAQAYLNDELFFLRNDTFVFVRCVSVLNRHRIGRERKLRARPLPQVRVLCVLFGCLKFSLQLPRQLYGATV